jgi:redox-sensitive bicupin YhaK (pirin superfamily)
VLLLARRGAPRINGDTRLGQGHLAMLDRAGETFTLEAEGAAASILVLGGEPIREAVVGQGPFVMNTRAEIDQAYADYRSGRMGRLR